MPKAGSAIVFVSLILSFVSIIAILFTRNALLHYNFALDRLHHTRSKLALDALTQYGISQIIHHKKSVWDEKIEKWPPRNGSYQGRVKGTLTGKKWKIQSELFKHNCSLGKASCMVSLSEDQEVIIDGWAYQ